MSFIDEFLKSEEQRMTWFDKLFMNYPNIEPTNAIAQSYTNNKKLPKQVIIRSSLWTKVISIFILLILSIVWIGLLRLVLTFRFPFVVFCGALLFITFIIYIVLNNAFFNKKLVYNIILDGNGIGIGKQMTHWIDITETYIMNWKQTPRKHSSFLILFRKDHTIEKHDLFQFDISDAKLAAFIEYYKIKEKTK